jgi:sugar lactone lactonase YvrE
MSKVMRNLFLIFLAALGGLGLPACAGKRLHAGDDGAGGGQAGMGGHAGTGGGQAGALSGAAGSILPSGTGGKAGAGGAAGTGGAAVAGAGGTTGAGGTGGAGAAAGAGGAPGSGGAGGATGAGGAAGDAAPGLRLLAGGLGGPGYADGPGATARFNYPVRIASDGVGNLYVVEQNNYTIRKIATATATVTTLAGSAHERGTEDGTGTAARFSDLRGIASDGAGNLYVLDANAIRTIAIATGAVTTLVDDTTAAVLIANPTGIAADRAGYLYVTDSNADPYGMIHSAIRKIAIANGTVTTVANRFGVSVPFDDLLFDVAVDGTGNLYVASGTIIQKIVIATGVVTTLAGAPAMLGSVDGTGAAARFGAPSGLAVDGMGNLFVADADITTGSTVRRVVVATGAVTTLAGKAGTGGSDDGIGAAARFGYPLGIASDGAGNLYVADIWANTIRKIVVATAAVTTFAGATEQSVAMNGTGPGARFAYPQGIATDGAGNLYVADVFSEAIRKVVIATGAVTTLAGGQQGSADGIGSAASFYRPSGIAADGAGNLFVTDTYNGTIRKVVIATGAVTTFAGAPGGLGRAADGTGAAAGFNFPSGIAADGGGNLYVTDANSIRKIVIATRTVTTFAGTIDQPGTADGIGTAASFNAPVAIATDGAGNLFVADTGSSTVRRIGVATRAVTTLAGTAGVRGSADGTGAVARFNEPHGIASDGAGNLYVADGGGTIRKIAVGSASVSTVIGSSGHLVVSPGALPAALNSPYGLVVLPTGELAIVDNVESSVLIGHL